MEDAAQPLAAWALKETGCGNLCIGGGVGLNVKMNSRLFPAARSGADLSTTPLQRRRRGGRCRPRSLLAGERREGLRPSPPSPSVPRPTDASIEATLEQCGISFSRPTDIAEAVAEELTEGKVVGWFQGRMEAGPRALGQRSILADPRRVEARDRVNAVIKYREDWRPFCPSILAEAASRYLTSYDDAPFMITAFEATDVFKRDAPSGGACGRHGPGPDGASRNSAALPPPDLRLSSGAAVSPRS